MFAISRSPAEAGRDTSAIIQLKRGRWEGSRSGERIRRRNRVLLERAPEIKKT
jgi:hypothetical protein